MLSSPFFIFFFFNDTATTEIYTLSLHDALPISSRKRRITWSFSAAFIAPCTNPRRKLGKTSRLSLSYSTVAALTASDSDRSEEHTSELQSHLNLVCRLLLEKKKNEKYIPGILCA